MGVLYRAIENPRQSGSGAETGRGISLAPTAFAFGAREMTKIFWSAGRLSRAFKHAGYCPFYFITRNARHVASVRWLLRMRARELQRDEPYRFIQRTVIRGCAQIVE